MSSFGQSTIATGGREISVAVNPAEVRWKPGGITIDWSTVPPLGNNESQTVTITGSPTGGTFTLTYAGQTTAAIAYNATAAAVEAALELLSTIGNGNVQVSGSDGGPYTVEFIEDLRNTNVAAMTASGASLTGGTSPGVTIATATGGVSGGDTTLADGRVVKSGDKYIRYGTVMSRITASGKYGPADTTASDGREGVAATQRGRSFILNRTIVMSELHSDHQSEIFDEGVVFRSRLNVDGTGQPTMAQLQTMMPAISMID